MAMQQYSNAVNKSCIIGHIEQLIASYSFTIRNWKKIIYLWFYLTNIKEYIILEKKLKDSVLYLLLHITSSLFMFLCGEIKEMNIVMNDVLFVNF